MRGHHLRIGSNAQAMKGRLGQTPLATMEDCGQQEMLNWMCLAGAMAELGRRPDETDFIQSYIFNSNKVFAIFKP